LTPKQKGAGGISSIYAPHNIVHMLHDSIHRKITYLRISVTDRCNLRCVYCLPKQGVVKLERREILSYEELLRLVRIGVELGLTKIRITGGEPLIRDGITSLIRAVSAVPGIQDLALTTNGTLLKELAKDLAGAGLHRVNVSLDTLEPGKYKLITRGGNLDQVLEGIGAAKEAGLHPVKVNMVVIRGVNDTEAGDFLRFAKEYETEVRFIEFMPYFHNEHFWGWDKVVPRDEIWKNLDADKHLVPRLQTLLTGPSTLYTFKDGQGSIGFIAPLSRRFCDRCNRLRLTADGALLGCLFGSGGVDIKTPLRRGADDNFLKNMFIQAAGKKPHRHHISKITTPLPSMGRSMSCIGG